MAKTILWKEGGITRESEESQLREAKEKLIKLFERTFVIIENNSSEYPKIMEHVSRLRKVVENVDQLSELTEVFFYQNLHSLAETILDKIGYQKMHLIQELYFAFTEASKSKEV